MREQKLYDSFLSEINQKLPMKAEVVNRLADMLCIGKEAVYRRLRREVPFTFFEAVTIAQQLGISLDGLETDIVSRTPGRLKLIEYINPGEADYALMEETIQALKAVDINSEAEAGVISNILPQILYVSYSNIFRFYLFKWKYYSNREKQAVPYKNIVIPDRLQKIQDEYVRYAKNLHIEYIFDPMLYQDLIHKVEYFFLIGLITKEDVRLIYDDLVAIFDKIDLLSRTGTFPETGKRVSLYISNLNIDTNYICMSAPGFQWTVIKAFLLNGVVSTDKLTFDEVKCWMHSMRQQSVLISGSSERERISFLEKQHQIIDQLTLL